MVAASLTSVTRLGDFWTFLVTYFYTKAAQIFGDFLSNFKKVTFKVKTDLAFISASFGENLVTFIPSSGHIEPIHNDDNIF